MQKIRIFTCNETFFLTEYMRERYVPLDMCNNAVIIFEVLHNICEIIEHTDQRTVMSWHFSF